MRNKKLEEKLVAAFNNNRNFKPSNEELAQTAVSQLIDEGARFVRKEEIENGELVYRIYLFTKEGERYLVDPGSKNLIWAKEQHELTNTSTVNSNGKEVCQLIQTSVLSAATTLKFRSFSAIENGNLFIPITHNRLLKVSAEGIQEIPNGSNQDGIYVEHPTSEPFNYQADADVQQGLRLFEELVVETQATENPSHKWLVGMRLGLFPYIRQLVNRRQITNIRGLSQHGKTTGAERFTRLHGLGELRGNVSVAYVQRLGDMGLLGIDNREQAKLTEDWIQYLLFLATGAEAGRATQSGGLIKWIDRPVGVFTSIEGVVRTELSNRTLSIQYHLSEATERLLENRLIEQIERNRDLMLSALMKVFVLYFQRKDSIPTFKPFSPNFKEDFDTNVGLLLAYAEASGRQQSWAESIVNQWQAGQEREVEDTSSELASLLMNMIDNYESAQEATYTNFQSALAKNAFLDSTPYNFNGIQGTLYITSPQRLLTPLRKLAASARQDSLPLNAQGLGARLRELKAEDGLLLLTEQDEPNKLKRLNSGRRIGLFKPSDSGPATSPLPTETTQYADLKVT
jgi:hypothetical protein